MRKILTFTLLIYRFGCALTVSAANLSVAPGILADEPSAQQTSGQLIIFAASSLKGPLEALEARWSEAHEQAQQGQSRAIGLSIGPSGTLARQVVFGAPADIFLSANRDWIDYVRAQRPGLEPAHPIIGNRVVYAAPTAHPIHDQRFTSPAEAILYSARIALAEPRTAPLGAYSRTFLEKLGLWQEMQGKIAFGQSARQTLLLVERGGTPGFVYESDARNNPLVRIIDVVSEASPTPPQVTYYGLAVGEDCERKRCKAFLDFLASPAARDIWMQHGFRPL